VSVSEEALVCGDVQRHISPAVPELVTRLRTVDAQARRQATASRTREGGDATVASRVTSFGPNCEVRLMDKVTHEVLKHYLECSSVHCIRVRAVSPQATGKASVQRKRWNGQGRVRRANACGAVTVLEKP
jgi:hypothetical protein